MESLVEYLRNVYEYLVLSTIVAGISVITTALFVNNFLYYTIISAVGSATFFILVILTPNDCSTRAWRIGYLMGFAGFSGIGVTDLFKSAIKEEPNILISTLTNTLTIFICLSTCALVSERNQWIFMGLPLTITLFTLLVISFANVFEESYIVSKTLVCLSLLTVCGLVLYDTQVALQKFEIGDKDIVRRGMTMFTDFFGIYRRLLILAVDKQKQASRLGASILRDEHNLQISGSVPLLTTINNLS